MKNKNQDKGPVDWGRVKVFLNKPIKCNSLGGVISFLTVLLTGLFFAQLILNDHLKVKSDELDRKGRNYNVGQSVERLKRENNLNKKNTYNARPLSQDSEKVIYINSQNKYQRGGVIMQSTLDEPIIHISGKNINSKTKVEIFEADTKNIIDSLVYKKKEGDENQRVYQKETPEIDINDFSKISEFESVVPKNRNIERQKVQLPINGEGNWLVRVSAEGISSMTFIARYNFGVVVKEGKDKFVFWSQDLINKKSAEDVEISGYNLSEEVKERFKDSTNESGILELDRDKVGDSDILVAERNGSGVIVPFRMRYQHYHSGYDFDYSHYLTMEEAEKMDSETEEALESWNLELIESWDDKHLDSSQSLVAVMEIMRGLGVKNIEILENTNSGRILDKPFEENTSYFEAIFF